MELDDDLDESLRGRRRSARSGQRGQRGEKTDPEDEQPLQIVNGTSAERGSWRCSRGAMRSDGGAAGEETQQQDHQHDDQ
jgi:hypothetical protein